MAETHLLMKIITIQGTFSMIKEIADSSKKARNPMYEESNVVFDKIKKRYLGLAPSFRLFGNLAY